VYWGYHRQGSCQAGLSAAISKVIELLLIIAMNVNIFSEFLKNALKKVKKKLFNNFGINLAHFRI
jgi:preprotein translocase subunit YajC